MTREEAITRLKIMAWLYGSVEREQNIEAIDMAIEALSERTGEWIDTGNWIGIECSRCKCHSRYVTPFCPQCGARMKGGDTE